MAYYGTRSSDVIPAVGGIPARFNLQVTNYGRYQFGWLQANTGYQQKMDSRYGGNSDLVSYFDRQRDAVTGGYESNYRSFKSSQFNSGEDIGSGASKWRLGQKLDEFGGLKEFKFPGAGAPSQGTVNTRAISMPSSGETVDRAIEAIGLRRSESGVWANQQDQYAFEDLTALKASGNIYAPSTQFVIKKQGIINAGMAADIKSQGERLALEARARNKASEEASKRKTSFRNTTINMARNGLRIPSGTGS